MGSHAKLNLPNFWSLVAANSGLVLLREGVKGEKRLEKGGTQGERLIHDCIGVCWVGTASGLFDSISEDPAKMGQHVGSSTAYVDSKVGP